ncbi:Cobalt/nickel transport system permease protein [uncultured Defluviicoccus sp.]|uniref:Cobalt/nickel transport system permease protein n=1 Tax=metagenome TaxID=256318 RepID=A0A380TAS6_9ZZZZ|nr:Cobalt/nickel transport system permease protein [uncultured Defluviicoccus sp.]
MTAFTSAGSAATAPAAGLLDAVSPSTRVGTAIAFAVATVALDRLPLLAAALAIAVVLAALARLPAASTARRLAGMDAFMLAVLAFLPFTVPGTPLFAVAGLSASAEGLRQAVAIVLTANTIVLAVLALVGTLEPVALGRALAALKVPDKVVHLLLFTVRYIAVLKDEYGRMVLAMRARGFRPRGNRHTWNSFGWLFGMLLVRSFERSERIHAAMKCRGFSGRFYLVEAEIASPADLPFAAGFGALMVLLLVAKVVW